MCELHSTADDELDPEVPLYEDVRYDVQRAQVNCTYAPIEVVLNESTNDGSDRRTTDRGQNDECNSPA